MTNPYSWEILWTQILAPRPVDKSLGDIIRGIPYCVGAFLACVLLLTPFIVVMLMFRGFRKPPMATQPPTCVHNFHPAYPDDRCPDCRAWYD